MAQNKTKFTDASVEDYIAARGSEQQLFALPLRCLGVAAD
jgi:hypothetical protein